MKTDLLTLRQLSISYRRDEQLTSAVSDVDLRVYKGEIVGIVGESGCGKSTLARAILGLLPKDIEQNGQIIFQDDELHKFTERQFQSVRSSKISIVFQDPLTYLNPTQRIGNQIAEVSYHKKGISWQAAIDEAIDLLTQLNFPEPAKRVNYYPHSLSGGQRQRVMLAIALICQPSLLIGDEPTTALDVTVQKQVLDIVAARKEKMSTIWITHDLDLTHSFCDRVAVMRSGKIVEEGTTEKIFNSPEHPYTQALLASRLTTAGRRRKQ